MKNVFFYLVISFLLSVSLFSKDASDMLEDVLNGVVTVAVFNIKEDNTSTFLGTRGDSESAYSNKINLRGSQGSGSGFIIEKNKKYYVITNAHVIDNADTSKGSIFVYSVNQSKYEVKLVGGDTFFDIAILEFIDKPGREIKPLEFRKKNFKIGESVYAIGNPLGEYPYSISDGIISGINRSSQSKVFGLFGFLQSTATIIWGNSGGPLVDSDGKVVGMNSQISFAYNKYIQPQINFALESKICQRIINDVLENKGFVKRVFLGAEFSKSYDIIDNYYYYTEYEIDTIPILNGVIPNSPAYEYLQNYVGCEILEINSKKIYNLQDILEILEFAEIGKPLTFKFKKDNKIFNDIEVIPQELNNEHLSKLSVYFFKKYFNTDLELTKNGLELRSLTYSIPQKSYDDEDDESYDDDSRSWKRGPSKNKNVSIQNERYLILNAGTGNILWSVDNKMILSSILKIAALNGEIQLNLKKIDFNSNRRNDKFNFKFYDDDGNNVKYLLY